MKRKKTCPICGTKLLDGVDGKYCPDWCWGEKEFNFEGATNESTKDKDSKLQKPFSNRVGA